MLLLVRLARMAGYRLGQALAAMEMRTHEFAVLNHLAEAGPLSQQELGRALRINPSNLVGLLDLLEADGLLVRARDPRGPAPPPGAAHRRRTAAPGQAWRAAEASRAGAALPPLAG